MLHFFAPGRKKKQKQAVLLHSFFPRKVVWHIFFPPPPKKKKKKDGVSALSWTEKRPTQYTLNFQLACYFHPGEYKFGGASEPGIVSGVCMCASSWGERMGNSWCQPICILLVEEVVLGGNIWLQTPKASSPVSWPSVTTWQRLAYVSLSAKFSWWEVFQTQTNLGRSKVIVCSIGRYFTLIDGVLWVIKEDALPHLSSLRELCHRYSMESWAILTPAYGLQV